MLKKSLPRPFYTKHLIFHQRRDRPEKKTELKNYLLGNL